MLLRLSGRDWFPYPNPVAQRISVVEQSENIIEGKWDLRSVYFLYPPFSVPHLTGYRLSASAQRFSTTLAPEMESEAFPSVRKDDLCPVCKGIDLDKLFGRQYLLDADRQRQGKFVMDLDGSAESLSSSTCPLCRLFGLMSYKDPDLPRLRSNIRTTIHLHAHCGIATTSGNLGRHEQSTCFISVLETNGPTYSPYSNLIWRETGFLSLVSPILPRQALAVHALCRERYDVEFVRRCVTKCRESHDHLCNNPTVASIRLLRLIDCQSGKIITAAPNAEYVALSYVWGAPITTLPRDDLESQPFADLPNCPKVVTDSMQVVLDLNFKYLWVDKYCIDQLDEEDKALQIRQMDLIYTNAQVTIIAAAGEGPYYGLPGVAGTLRQKQPALKIGNHYIASTLPHGRTIVPESKWATRGWTYQETIFSKRRLIFTDQQVFWECNNMYCAEIIQNPPGAEHSYLALQDDIFGFKIPGEERWKIMSFISEFRQRELTYQSDSINALSGIFRAFERAERPMYQVMGVPIFPSLDNYDRIRAKSTSQGFLIGLTWVSKVLGQKRVPEFPSWSWAGWTGRVEPSLALYRNHEENSNDASVQLETSEGNLLNFPAHQSHLPEFLSQLPRDLKFIHIEAKTFTCIFQPNQPRGEFPQTSPLKARLHISVNATFFLECTEERDPSAFQQWSNPLTGILLGDTSGASLYVAALIVQKVDGYYKRVDCVPFNHLKFESAGEDLLAVRGGMGLFAKWMREETVRKTLRLG